MKFLKILVCVQALGLVYLLRENTELQERIVTSADAIAKSTRTIESLIDQVEAATRRESDCIYTMNKYRDEQEQKHLFPAY